MHSPPARKDRNFRHPSVLPGARDVNGLGQWSGRGSDSGTRRHGRGRRKTLAKDRLFSYNDKCLLLFEQVTKREGGEARINLVDGLCSASCIRYIPPNMFGPFCASAYVFFDNREDPW
jgi:hypothetical protein